MMHACRWEHRLRSRMKRRDRKPNRGVQSWPTQILHHIIGRSPAPSKPGKPWDRTIDAEPSNRSNRARSPHINTCIRTNLPFGTHRCHASVASQYGPALLDQHLQDQEASQVNLAWYFGIAETPTLVIALSCYNAVSDSIGKAAPPATRTYEHARLAVLTFILPKSIIINWKPQAIPMGPQWCQQFSLCS